MEFEEAKRIVYGPYAHPSFEEWMRMLPHGMLPAYRGMARAAWDKQQEEITRLQRATEGLQLYCDSLAGGVQLLQGQRDDLKKEVEQLREKAAAFDRIQQQVELGYKVEIGYEFTSQQIAARITVRISNPELAAVGRGASVMSAVSDSDVINSVNAGQEHEQKTS